MPLLLLFKPKDFFAEISDKSSHPVTKIVLTNAVVVVTSPFVVQFFSSKLSWNRGSSFGSDAKKNRQPNN
jgi:hypothetical protein